MSKKEFRSARFWSNVESLMHEKETSAPTLSLAIGTTQNYITSAMHYKGVPNVAIALAIANFFGVTVEELAYGNVGLEIRKKRLMRELEAVNKELEEIEKEA